MPNLRNRRRTDIEKNIQPDQRNAPVSDSEEIPVAPSEDETDPLVDPVKTNWVN